MSEAPAGRRPGWAASTPVQVAQLVFFLYTFLVSIGLLGKGFKLFGGGLVEELIDAASNPLLGLFEGILATTLLQSSSTTTSLVVALVASGTMPISSAIFVVMGANIGTTVTNTLVSLGHLGRSEEFNRAFAASTVHDFFNLLAVAILLPLQATTNFLGVLATWLTELFQEVGGLTFASPLKIVTAPAVDGIAGMLHDHPWLLLLLALTLLFVSLRFLVVTLKGLMLTRIESLFDEVIFKNAARAMVLGLVFTVLVQSSSITTSLAVPLAGAGVLTLVQIFPYTLGANVGTTVTAILAALAVSNPAAVTVAFAHLLFNVIGIGLVWPVRAIRRLPIRAAELLASVGSRNRWLAVVYVVIAFYVVPFLGILFLR